MDAAGENDDLDIEDERYETIQGIKRDLKDIKLLVTMMWLMMVVTSICAGVVPLVFSLFRR